MSLTRRKLIPPPPLEELGGILKASGIVVVGGVCLNCGTDVAESWAAALIRGARIGLAADHTSASGCAGWVCPPCLEALAEQYPGAHIEPGVGLERMP